MAKVVISCAVTGSAHTPAMSDVLPVTPQEISDQSIATAEAGAAILHLHARVPEDGRPTGDPEIYNRFLPQIRQRIDAVVNITTGGAVTMTQAALLGGHVRVGLEDSLFIERGQLAASNAQQVEKTVRILREIGHEPASPAEARTILGLKRGDRVEF